MAIKDFNFVLNKRADKFSYRFRGKSYHALNMYKKAIEDYNSFILLSPEFPDIYYEKGLSYVKLGKYQEAIEDFTTAISKDADNYLYFLNRGNAYYHTGNNKKCLADFNHMILLKPESPRLYGARYLVHNGLNMQKEALFDANMIIKYTKERSGYYQRANTYASLGRIDDAIADYSLILKRKENYMTYLNRSLMYKLKRETKKALNDVRVSKKLKPEFPYSRIIGYLLEKELGFDQPDLKFMKSTGDYALWVNNIIRYFKGEKSLDQLLRAAKGKNREETLGFRCEAYYYVAEFHRIKGDKKTARHFYKKCIETNAYNIAEHSAALYEYKLLKNM